MPERGEINNPERAAQLRDFSGIRFHGIDKLEKITPTDIDGLIDFKNRLFIIMEFKYKDTQILTGQKLALERLCDSIKGIPSYCLIASHENEIGTMIDTANAVVCEYRQSGEWRIPSNKINIKEAINRLLKKHEIINDKEYNTLCANDNWEEK